MDTDIRVLIVDDDKTMLHILRGLLNQIGFADIDQVQNGSEAMEKFNEHDYGLVISEWEMEPLSGFELLKSIRASVKNKNIPFIMMTATSKTEKVMRAKNAGVSNFIVKPFNADTLKKKINNVL